MRYVLLTIFLFYSTFVRSQTFPPYPPPIVVTPHRDSELKLFAYNVSFGGLTAGIGAVINKPKETPAHKAFLTGFYQGCFGGALQYSGKKMVYQIVKHENYWYGWPAKIVHTAGASVVENAALNRPFGRYWNLDLGLLRFDFAFAAEDNNTKVRLNAMYIYDIVVTVVESSSAHIDWGKSLKLGTLAFYTNEPLSGHKRQDIVGRAYSKAFIYTRMTSSNIHKTVAHELIHLFQYREHLVFNAWLNPLTSKASPKIINIFQNTIYVEPPYFTPLYLIQGYHSKEHYYRNFYEYEAEWFATKGYF